MTAATKWPNVTILSDRPAKGGRKVNGNVGEGTIMPDEPDKIYVNAPGWYGEWPVEETDVPKQIADKAAVKNVANLPADTELDAFSEGYERLIQKLTEFNPDLANVTRESHPTLITREGRYLRLPTLEEFQGTFRDLQDMGLIEG